MEFDNSREAYLCQIFHSKQRHLQIRKTFFSFYSEFHIHFYCILLNRSCHNKYFPKYQKNNKTMNGSNNSNQKKSPRRQDTKMQKTNEYQSKCIFLFVCQCGGGAQFSTISNKFYGSQFPFQIGGPSSTIKTEIDHK